MATLVIGKKILNYVCSIYNTVRYLNGKGITEKVPWKQRDPNNVDKVFNFYDVGHVQGFFTKRAGTLYIHFIGSNEISDWFYNFLFKKVNPQFALDENIKVHSGFLKSYMQARDSIWREAEKSSRIIVTGHSLGGAMATLAAFDLSNVKSKSIQLCITGSPKVGNKAFIKELTKRIKHPLSVINGNDLVPALPPKWFGFDVLPTIYLNKSKRRMIPTSKSDHHIVKYMEAIEKEL